MCDTHHAVQDLAAAIRGLRSLKVASITRGTVSTSWIAFLEFLMRCQNSSFGVLRPWALAMTATLLASCAKEPPPVAPPQPPAVVEEVIPDAPYCAKPAEKSAFDVAALKTQLMIAALSCGNTDRYNGFVTKNRTGLVVQEKALSGYFTRNYGKSGQKAQDDYITQLANMQAQRRTRDTDAFCKDTAGTFEAAANVKTVTDLTTLATAKQVVQPMKVAECK